MQRAERYAAEGGYLQSAATVGGADGYRAWSESLDCRHENLEKYCKKQGRRALSAVQHPTDAMKRNVMG
jgi:hypothetical protein